MQRDFKGFNAEMTKTVLGYRYTTLTNLSMKYFVICEVYTDEGGINI